MTGWQITIMLIVIAGMLGSYVSVYIDKGKLAKGEELFGTLLAGIVAASLVPVLLILAQSKVIEEIVNTTPGKYENYFLFFGFAIAASYTSKKFIGDLSKKILQNFKKNEQAIVETQERNEKLAEAVIISDKINSETYIGDELGEKRVKDYSKEILELVSGYKSTRRKFLSKSDLSSILEQSKNKIGELLDEATQLGLVSTVNYSTHNVWYLTTKGGFLAAKLEKENLNE